MFAAWASSGERMAALPGLFALPDLRDLCVLLDFHAQPPPHGLGVQRPSRAWQVFIMSWRLVSGCLHMCNLGHNRNSI